ncbi:WD40 repeat domain-containing protein [Streptomyces sp. NPDC058691]|uniref:WD40 repeat domain-containing protein n=1 Tax=Streptomyces sp. NPDC058691 TaxID=3346601 RepID=UPI00365CBDB2
MRLARIALAAAVSLVVPVMGPATPATATNADSGTPLPLTNFSSMLVDASHDHLILGDWGHGVLVTDLAGHPIAEVPEPGTEGIALSPDNRTLYVAMGTSDAIAAIDMNTLTEVAHYETGQGIQPHAVAFSAGKIWFGYYRDAWTGGLGSIDPAQGAPSETLEEIGRAGALAASPAAPGTLVGSFDDGNGELDTFDVSSGTPRVVARRSTWSWELAISPDGKYVATSVDGVLRVDDLARSGLYPSFHYGQAESAPAFAADGTLAFAEQDGEGPFLHYVVRTLGPQGEPLRTYTFGPEQSGEGVIAGLGWVPDGSRLLAVDAQGSPYSLHALGDPEKADIELAPLETDPWLPVAEKSFELTIAARSAKEFDRNTVLHVTRTDANHPGVVVLPDVPVRLQAAYPPVGFVIRDTAPAGTYTYHVTLDGDATHMAADSPAPILVHHPTALTVATDATTYSYDATAKVTAHLGTTQDTRKVSIYAQPYGGKKTLIKTATVDSHGNLATSYKLTRSTTFTAAFVGDSAYPPATATRTAGDHVKVAVSLSSYYTSTHYGSTLYRVYHHTDKAKENVTVTPNKDGQCLRFETQRYYKSAWHTLSTSSCSTLSRTSTGSGTMALSHATNQRLRMRAEYVHSSKDNTNLDTWGAWQYFTVRR